MVANHVEDPGPEFGAHKVSAERDEPITKVWGKPPAGCRGRAPGQKVRGRAPDQKVRGNAAEAERCFCICTT